jgi:hypothetical protein
MWLSTRPTSTDGRRGSLEADAGKADRIPNRVRPFLLRRPRGEMTDASQRTLLRPCGDLRPPQADEFRVW